LFVSAAMTTAAIGQAPTPPYVPSQEAPPRPKELTVPQIPHPARAEAPDADYELMQDSASTGSIRSNVSSVLSGTTLTPPVTITYSGSSNAVTINDSGTNRGLSSSLTNTGNNNSAVYGETKGGGAGVKGINSGVNGSAGVFFINNSASAKAAVNATTNGTGSALTATITNTSSNQPAIIGMNTASANNGIGVEGTSNNIAVYGVSGGTSGLGYGVYGYAPTGSAGAAGLSSTGIGVLAESTSSYGLFAESSTSYGVYGYSGSSNGVHASSYNGDAISASSTYGRGMTVHSANAIGIYSSSDSSYGIWGQSTNQYGVIGEDAGSGIGVYGSSASGYAGYFAGKVAATSYLTVSDRNKKTDFAPVDGSRLLDRVSRLPITSWAFKDDRKLRHIGPMAQDFHAAFGLDGDDDKHISLSDAAGVSLAAIQELNKRLQEKDARIAALEQQVKTMNGTFEARLAKLEERVAPTAQIKTAY
jgi:hypothetical protein